MAISTITDRPIGGSAVHICVDMQRLFGEGSDWALPWLPRVVPNIAAICRVHAARTIFTRFIPARRPGDGQGAWREYYRRWASMTIEAVGPQMIALVPELGGFSPPAEVVDKPVYSPWLATDLGGRLQARRCDTVVITGGETDVCVLATVLGAVDFGYRSIVVRDALCSASDEDHDAMLELYGRRFSQFVETATTEEVLALWEPAR